MVNRKKCFLPWCKNREDTGKIFVTVPRSPDWRRRDWLAVAGIAYPNNNTFHCCEDHFVLPDDATNWMYFRLMGCRITLKPHVVPRFSMFCEAKSEEGSNESVSGEKTKIKTYACHVCAETFERHDKAVEHDRNYHHINYQSPFVDCDASPKSISGQHSYMDEDFEKPWLCDECGESFSSEDNLTSHSISQHSTNSPLEWEVELPTEVDCRSKHLVQKTSLELEVNGNQQSECVSDTTLWDQGTQTEWDDSEQLECVPDAENSRTMVLKVEGGSDHSESVPEANRSDQNPPLELIEIDGNQLTEWVSYTTIWDQNTQTEWDENQQTECVPGDTEMSRTMVVKLEDESELSGSATATGPLLPFDRVLDRTSAALKLKPAVIVRLTRNGTALTQRPDVNMRLHPLRIDAIKNFVEMYYRTDPNASITKAYEKLVRSGLFNGSHTTLRRMLQNEGFDFIRGKRRCEAFTKVKHEFIFEDYMKDEDEPKRKEAKKSGEETSKLEPLDSLQCEKEDLEFFRSVLPSVAKLNDCDKLNFRMAVMGKVQNLLYQPSLPTPSAPSPPK